jgi:signal peptidase I
VTAPQDPPSEPAPPTEPALEAGPDAGGEQATATGIDTTLTAEAGSYTAPTTDGGTRKQRSAAKGALEWVLVIGGAVLLAIIVKAVLLQAFYIPSASMYPTLQKGDRVLVNKLSYKLHDVNRGDVVVFEKPPSEVATDIPDLIKRVVGLPGESIVIEGGHVYVDGQLLDEPYLPDGTTTSADASTLHCTREAPCVVPEGDVWVMGDNRNDSKDSRYFGPIDEDSIVGRAFVIVWPLNRIGLL